MFKLADFFNIKRDLAGDGGDSGAPPASDAPPAAAAPAPAATPPADTLLGGDAKPPAQPEAFLQALPGADDKEGWSSLFNKLGRPESADGYELPLPEGDSGEFAKTSAGWMHEAGLSKQQAQALAVKWNEHQAAHATAAEDQRSKQIDADMTAVKQEWGDKFDANLAVVRKAVSQFAPPELIQMLDQSGLINSPIVTNMFLKIGSAISEDALVSSNKDPSQAGEKSIADRLWGSN